MPAPDADIAAFSDFVRQPRFACVGAKSALARDGLTFVVAGNLHCGASDEAILTAVGATPELDLGGRLYSTVVLFPATPPLDERAFEAAMWARLRALHARDRLAFDWDPRVSNDPASPRFGMSLAARGFFVVGMHPGAARASRRAPSAALVFNPHAQFRRLKADRSYARVQQIVRRRELAVQGSLNPMLSEHGRMSEASQYSGREVGADWRCPFQARARDAA